MLTRNLIEDTLIKIGVPAGVHGFRYITDAIMLLDKPEWKNIKTIAIYENVAKMNNSTCSRVERSIRHAFAVTRRYSGETDDVLYYIGGEGSKNADSLRLLYTRLKNERESSFPKLSSEEINENEVALRRIIREEVREVLKGILLGGDTL